MKKALLHSVILILIGLILVGISFVCGADVSKIPTTLTDSIPLAQDHISFEENDNKYEADNCYEIAAEGITELKVDWLSGSVDIMPYDGDVIRISETLVTSQAEFPEITKEYALRYSEKNGVLSIRFCKEDSYLITPVKALLVEIPAEQYFDLLNVSATSADIFVSQVSGDTLLLDSTSGSLNAACVFTDVQAASTSGNIDLDGDFEKISAEANSGSILIRSAAQGSAAVSTTSGDVRLLGDYFMINTDVLSGSTVILARVTDLTMESTSGDMILETDQCPEMIIANSTSGDVKLSLPEDSKISLVYDTTSGELSSTLPILLSGEDTEYGDGFGDFFVSTTSGSLTIR